MTDYPQVLRCIICRTCDASTFLPLLFHTSCL